MAYFRSINLLVALAFLISPALLWGDELATQFTDPPATARPWVYWFWNNGNVTKTGITADLEAMQRVGIGGVIIMDVLERFAPPAGTADYMSTEWQELVHFAVSEANRVGIEINMTNGPGWCGSSGPWVTPEMSMQKLVATDVVVQGPANFSSDLPRPDTAGENRDAVFDSKINYEDFYRDVVVLAVPADSSGVVAKEAVLDLSEKLNANGRLNWEVPSGKWSVYRIGSISTGMSTRPPVKGGNGLEIDKLSSKAMDLHFSHMMGRLIEAAGPLAGSTLASTHIDSWEVGSQNWTPLFRQEFKSRRGYELTPYLLNLVTDQVRVGPGSEHDRFLWDFQRTRSELLAENYVGRLAQLAHRHGMRLSIEGYHLPFGDEATYTARADEPMSEFWSPSGMENEAMARQMASVAHTTGKLIVGAEAFTAGESDNWSFHPATVKAIGDYQFCQGINRFVIHRYAHQPYLDRYPGATMGPWGLHYERTQTWWNMSTAWHKYLARCQHMLRQGVFVADLCYLRPEKPDQTSYKPVLSPPIGHRYDECSAEVLINRADVANGQVTFPGGMNYRVLVLPSDTSSMTPKLANAIKRLVSDGAIVVGPRPTSSPSLVDYPECDAIVSSVGKEVWGECDGKAITEHRFGSGKVIWGQGLEKVLGDLQCGPDFTADKELNWIHRQAGDIDVYFIANPADVAVEALCTFRMKGARPEIWNAETGAIGPLAVYQTTPSGTIIPLRLEASESVFIVFRSRNAPSDPGTELVWDGRQVPPRYSKPDIHVESATYGVPGDATRSRDVREKVLNLMKAGVTRFYVRELARDDDPAFGVVKTVVLKHSVDGKTITVTAQDPDVVDLNPSIIFTTGAGGGAGLKGEYFPNRELSGAPTISRVESFINFNWGDASLGPGMPATNWSARWTGVLTPRESAHYTFRLFADDGCRLFINDAPVIDHWSLDSGAVAHTGRIALEAGQSYKVRVEYFQGEVDSNIRLDWLTPADRRPAEVRQSAQSSLEIVATHPGNFQLTTASGKMLRAEIAHVPTPKDVIGPWEVQFSEGWGAPQRIDMSHLSSLSESKDSGVKYFSGTARYLTEFQWDVSSLPNSEKSEVWLDLGEVQVMAHVVLNNHDLGVCWKPPFVVNVTKAIKPGQNRLEVRVANLWPNRMIGDHNSDSKKQYTWSSFDPFNADSPLPRSGLIGPVQLQTKILAPLQ